jgi:hypothetical protein
VLGGEPVHDAAVRIFRVIVRGRFHGLDPLVTAQLLADLEGRSELDSYVFTKAGTLVYDKRLDFWSFRVEVRVEDDQDPHALAQGLATAELERLGATWRDLRRSGTDMASVWR